MPTRKRVEGEFATLMKNLPMIATFTHKWRDRGYVSCPKCHRPQKKCWACQSDMLMPKAQSWLDYTTAFDYMHVECKQGGDSWQIDDFTDNQVKTIANMMSEGEDVWLFLELGPGAAPRGRSAWLIDWIAWSGIVDLLDEKGVKSIRYENSQRSRVPTADETIDERWKLEWIRGQWTIPQQHPFWDIRIARLTNLLSSIRPSS